MKKIMLIALSVALLLTFTACSSSEESASEVVSSVASQPVAESAPEAASEVEVTMDDFVTAIKAENEAQFADLLEQGIEADIIARDNDLVYTYKFTTDIGDISEITPVVEEEIEGLASFFQTSYDTIKLTLPELNAVVLEYYTMDDELIFDRAFN